MRIELLKPHTHAGAVCKPGCFLDLDPDLAQWLVDGGIASYPAISSPSVSQPPKTLSRSEEKLK